MSNTFEQAFDRVIGNEGGYVNNPGDPGGETNWGISKRAYPNVDIKNLTREEAKAIYRADFWNRLGTDRLPASVVFQMFDFAVNSGIETAIRAYQRAIGLVDDGNFGPVCITRATTLSDNQQLMLLIAERLDFMRTISTWQTFGKGWVRRIAADLRYAAQDS